MKKLFSVLILISVLFCGCRQDDQTASEHYNEISKAQEIAVVSCDASDVIRTLTSKEDIDAFITDLGIDNWELGKLPKETKEIGSFCLLQEETVKLWQTETDGELYDVCKISVYEASYIKFETVAMSMVFKISEDTADDLKKYFFCLQCFCD